MTLVYTAAGGGSVVGMQIVNIPGSIDMTVHRDDKLVFAGSIGMGETAIVMDFR